MSTAWDDYTGLADGIRADTDGNIWAGIGQGANGTGSAKAEGDGVYAISPQGVKIGKNPVAQNYAAECPATMAASSISLGHAGLRIQPSNMLVESPWI